VSNPIDEGTVAHITRLAQLHLPPTEAAALVHDMQRIVGYVQLLESADTEGVAPMRHPTAEATPLRDDVAGGELSEEQALGNAPARSGRCFSVPRVVG